MKQIGGLYVRCVRWVAALAAVLTVTCVSALPADVVKELAFGEGDAKAKAIGALITLGDPAALPLLQALIDGEMQTVGEDRVLIVKGETATDAVTGKAVAPLPGGGLERTM